MRELILNEASFPSTVEVPGETATDWLVGLSKGIAELGRMHVVATSLRTARALSQVPLGRNSFLDVRIRDLLGPCRESALFLMRLSTKSPLLCDLGDDVENRFRGCEVRGVDPVRGEALVLCAHLDGVAVGVPSAEYWDRDHLTVRFDELLPNETIEEVVVPIDHLARAEHASAISARHAKQLREGLDFTSFWKERQNAFPHLVFGPDVEDHISGMAATMLPTVVRKLAQLDASVAEWEGGGGPRPRWQCDVTRESATVRQEERLRRARLFRSVRGGRQVFEWHARFGNSGRIHLRFTAEPREVEIGYIGSHLPL